MCPGRAERRVVEAIGWTACLGWLLLGGATSAQDATGRLLLARVVDGQGRAIVDLALDDFVITEAGQGREVLDVHVADYPVVLLVDDGPELHSLPAIRNAAGRFIARIGDRPIAIGTLSDGAKMIAPFDLDRAELLSRVSTLTVGATTPLALPAVANAADLLRGTGAPFSAIVVVTGRPIDATAPVEGALLPSILESGAAVHVIENRTPAPGAAGPVAADTPDLLRVLADQSHGQYTSIFSAVSFSVALDRLADRLSSEFMVQYLVPPGGSAGDVRVGVRRIGARVLGFGVK